MLACMLLAFCFDNYHLKRYALRKFPPSRPLSICLPNVPATLFPGNTNGRPVRSVLSADDVLTPGQGVHGLFGK